MQLSTVTCPQCGTAFVVDTGLFDIGTVRLRCTACAHYFLPEASPRSRTVEDVCNASVSIAIWEPEEERG